MDLELFLATIMVDHFLFFVQWKLLALAEQVSYCKLSMWYSFSAAPPRHQHPRCFHCTSLAQHYYTWNSKYTLKFIARTCVQYNQYSRLLLIRSPLGLYSLAAIARWLHFRRLNSNPASNVIKTLRFCSRIMSLCNSFQTSYLAAIKNLFGVARTDRYTE